MRVVWKWKQQRDLLLEMDSTHQLMMIELRQLEIQYMELHRNYELEKRIQDAKDKHYAQRNELHEIQKRQLRKTIRKQRVGMFSGGGIALVLLILLI